MANFAISGVWKDQQGTITHYAVHSLSQNGSVSHATKTSKPDAIRLTETQGNSVITILWNYTSQEWKSGTIVNVVGTYPNKYLRTIQDGTVRDNLSHLINYNYVANNFI